MNFLSCEYFVAIYRAGSIRKAAGELFITQQALSGQLNKLERELGIQLMLRTTPVELTEAGDQFLLAATRILYIRDTLLNTHLERLIPQAEELLSASGQRIQDAAKRAYAGGNIGRDIYQAILAERKARQNSPSHTLALEETS